MNKLLLIDGNSIMNRAFYGIPDMTTNDGRHTNAIYGFLNIILKVIEEEQATHICVAFDLKKKTFRHEMYEAYKGTRKGMPEELHEQMPRIKEILQAMHTRIVEQEGFEADDLIGTLSKKGEREGFAVTILSGDRDLLQLATDTVLVRIPKTKHGKTEVEDYYAKNVVETYGSAPHPDLPLHVCSRSVSCLHLSTHQYTWKALPVVRKSHPADVHMHTTYCPGYPQSYMPYNPLILLVKYRTCPYPPS